MKARDRSLSVTPTISGICVAQITPLRSPGSRRCFVGKPRRTAVSRMRAGVRSRVTYSLAPTAWPGVEGGPGPVIAHGDPRVSVGRGFLHIPEWHAGVQGGGDEGVPQSVRPDGLGDPGAAGNPADDPPGAVPVQPAAVRSEEHRVLATLPDGQVDGRAIRGWAGW
jgi:antitoxin (DNA-binding transcriptional repressor) of toxin-antitoxin stability system